MADIIAHPRARTERVIQTRTGGRLPKTVISLSKVRGDLRFAAYKAQLIQEEIAKTLQACAEWEQVAASLRMKAFALQQQSQGVFHV